MDLWGCATKPIYLPTSSLFLRANKMPGIMCLEYIPYCAIVSGAHKKSDTRTYVQLRMSKTSFLVFCFVCLCTFMDGGGGGSKKTRFDNKKKLLLLCVRSSCILMPENINTEKLAPSASICSSLSLPDNIVPDGI